MQQRHPLLLFNQHGDCLGAKLRPGNVHSAEDWDELLLPEIERQQAEGKQVTFRADAAFAKPEIYEAMEERGVDYVIRIPANKSLELEIEDILFRPPGRPNAKPLVRYLRDAHTYPQVARRQGASFPPRMIADRSSPSRVRCAASRPGRLRADPGDVAVYEGKGMSRCPPAQISECARLIRASSSIAGTGLMSVSPPRDN